VILVVLASSIYLRVYTRHGQYIFTPTLLGTDVRLAKEQMKSRGLNVQVIDSIYSNDYPRGVIVDQTPPPNFHIKQGRTIFVTINAYKPKMVELPDLDEVSLLQARYDLENVGLKLGKVYYQPTPNFPNLVLAVLYKGDTIYPGYKLPQGTKIDLVVGKGVSVDSLLRTDSLSRQSSSGNNLYQGNF
jgi:beta-lactam-binding protein with PASTA domain